MKKIFTLLIFFICLTTPSLAEDETPIVGWDYRTHPTAGRYGMVVSQHDIASEVGAEILAKGGNAVDAAVATGFALAVVLPRAGNIGGGGFMLVYLADEHRTIALDYREKAPAAAYTEMFQDKKGNVNRHMATFTLASSGVPGTVAGFWHIQQKYGKLKWAEVLAPAIRLAKDGFPITLNTVNGLDAKRKAFSRTGLDAAMDFYFKPGGQSYEPGETFRQPALASTLEAIAKGGRDGFYKGPVADMIVAEMKKGNGLITHQDLEAYQPVEREPVTGTYRGYEIVSMPPPSSGGLHVIEMLNVLENFDLQGAGLGSAESYRMMAEAMKFAYADRSKYLGDPDFTDVPVKWLTSKEYAAKIAARIKAKPVTPSSEISPGIAAAPDSPDTTHFVVADKWGNVVSNTFTLNFSFGSGIAVDGAGFLLNDEMDDFSAKPGSPDAYGLIGGTANAIEGGKRPLSSMSPVIVLKDGKPVYALGSPGGSMIITAVMQTIVNMIDFKLHVGDAIRQSRVHHQWKPDRLLVDPYFNADTLRLLKQDGYTIGAMPFLTSVEGIEIQDNGWMFGYADERRADGAAVGLCQADKVVAC